jgi:hypothetical protein
MRDGRTDRAEMKWKNRDGTIKDEHFKISPVKDNLVILESVVYPEFFLRASKTKGDDQLNWAQNFGVDQNDLDGTAANWAKFRMHEIGDGIVAFESDRWPGLFVQDLSVPFGSVKYALMFKETDLATAKAQLYLQFKLVKV